MRVESRLQNDKDEEDKTRVGGKSRQSRQENKGIQHEQDERLQNIRRHSRLGDNICSARPHPVMMEY